MTAFADTNWLEALYFEPPLGDDQAATRFAVVQRRMRRHSDPLLISHIVLLEARNVFGRISGDPNPSQWQDLVADFEGRIFVDPMNWDLLRYETNALFERFSHRARVGTFDATLIASAQLSGARELLSFDETLKALAACLGLQVFPPLGAEGKKLLAQLRRP